MLPMRLRQSRGLTQEELALDAKIDLTYLGGIERGRRNPSLMVMAKIADALFVGFRARLTPPWAPVGRALPIHERSTRQHGEAMVAGIGIRVHRVRDRAVGDAPLVNAENALV
jgi:transcriptional regulator with XRE-family HTH domain